MRLLLDSHALIWYVDQEQLLSAHAHAVIDDPANDLLLSAATIWEIAIKVGLGKLTLTLPYREWMTRAISDLYVTVLPITVEHADCQSTLPFHHRDPFDRLLAAQAQVEGTPLVSGDPIFDQYCVVRA
ncbi:MAG: type II toxin-antitoxin system VapC family toxin [Planctomycetales bacterium]